MSQDPFSPEPLQPSTNAIPETRAQPSDQGPAHFTLKEAAREAGCSDSTLRRLVKAGEVPFTQEETKTGFRYMFEASTVPIIAHKAAMRRPSGRPSTRRAEGRGLQASRNGALQEASISREEVAVLRAERELLKAENQRLWAQIERLTESVAQLALPASRYSAQEGDREPDVKAEVPRRRFWDYFFGRRPSGGS